MKSSFVTASKRQKKNSKPRYKPHGYQKRGIKFVLQNGAAALFWDPGLGKTSAILGAFKILKDEGIVKKMLVIAPLRVAHSVWPNEVDKWLDFQDLKVVVLHGPDKASLLRETCDVLVINPEGLEWLSEQKGWSCEMLVVDESSKFKYPSTKRFKLLKKMLNKFKRRYILTGTPAPRSLIDLFGQVYILDGGATLGRYITQYRNKFFDKSGFGGYTYMPKEGAVEEVAKLLKPLVQRLKAEDYLKLPPLVVTDIRVDLPRSARKVYDEMEREFIAELEDGIVLAKTAAVATSKCRQVASGGIWMDNGFGIAAVEHGAGRKGREFVHIHSAKTDALLDLIEELSGAAALVVYDTHHDLDRIKKGLGYDVPYVGGGVSPKKGRELEQQWNAGELQVLCVHPQSASLGLNLQEAGKAVVWYSLTWDLEAYEQLYKRLLRQGRKSAVFVYRILANDTMDDVMVKNLESKDMSQKHLLSLFKDRYAKK